MKFAAIADIHGNSAALEAVLADIAASGIRDIVNLGDHVSGPLEPARTADMLMERGFPSVQGDQDRILVELQRNGGSKRADFAQLERRHFDWMAACRRRLSIATRSSSAMAVRATMRRSGSIASPPTASCVRTRSRRSKPRHRVSARR